MIQLNLLEKKKPVELPVIMGVDLNKVNKKSFILGYVIYYSLTTFLVPTFKEQNADIEAQITKQRSELRKLTNEVKKFGNLNEIMNAFDRRIKELQSREDLVAKVMSQKSNPYRVLRGLSESLNNDIWFNEVTIDDKKNITIKGESISFSSVGDFINNVKQLAYFSPMVGYSGETFGMKELKEVQEEMYGENITLQSFIIQGNIQSYGDLN